jgi:two-component system LytT family response regulator
MKINCLIVDDERGSHVVLEKYISRLADLVVCGNCYDAVSAYNFTREHPVDLIFLDINMPEVDGFSFLDMLENKPLVIFTTAYTDHALKGYEYNAIDYLHKPIRFERFVKATEKALKWLRRSPEKETIRSVTLSVNGTKQTVATDDIIYIQSIGNYVKIFCNNKKIIITEITTKELEGKLPLPLFIRIHRSYIVNTEKLTAIKDGHLLIDGISLPVGKTYVKYISGFIGQVR